MSQRFLESFKFNVENKCESMRDCGTNRSSISRRANLIEESQGEGQGGRRCLEQSEYEQAREYG